MGDKSNAPGRACGGLQERGARSPRISGPTAGGGRRRAGGGGGRRAAGGGRRRRRNTRRSPTPTRARGAAKLQSSSRFTGNQFLKSPAGSRPPAWPWNELLRLRWGRCRSRRRRRHHRRSRAILFVQLSIPFPVPFSIRMPIPIKS
ncbi:hypothetical protein EVAR_65618_1 [Eumeta japonica]|uniref:Uncharacterized protein n=1 Tax=Eumeta variegata TaxID=151549 RepID=A0A4C1Z769_EUMVA|nr:hypothetical protein EVAR_65618_1 [Eumeta japonica]